jgi:hypothetical protein
MLHRTWLFRVVIIVATTIGASFSSHAFDLLVVGNLSNDVRRFDATTGTFLGTFVSGLPAGPVDIALDPGGETVFISLNNDTLRSYDLSSGAFLGSMNNSGLSLGFGSDGKLYAPTSLQTRLFELIPLLEQLRISLRPVVVGLMVRAGLFLMTEPCTFQAGSTDKYFVMMRWMGSLKESSLRPEATAHKG